MNDRPWYYDELEEGPCGEPAGNVDAIGDGRTAHEVMIKEGGVCPWCGAD